MCPLRSLDAALFLLVRFLVPLCLGVAAVDKNQSGVSDLGSLMECLRMGMATVVAQGDAAYEFARLCKNRATEIEPWPLAVARVRSVEEVQEAVRCVAASRLEACARAGAHGFGNDGGCSGGVVIDVQDLLSLEVDADTDMVQFGAGNTLGQLYYKLHGSHGLAVAGGSVSGVGAAGLFLGCGRGLLTQLKGLACDTTLGIEYVDAHGKVQIADTTSNADMYWMARGGGGNFPGIVTKFTVQAFKAPERLYAIDCEVSSQWGRALMRSWLGRLEDMVQPQRRVFTHITVWGRVNFKLSNICIDCDAEQRAWFEETVLGVAHAAKHDAHCYNYTQTWIEQLLFESGMHEGMIENRPEALLDRDQGWGAKGLLANKNGGHMLYEYNMSEALMDTLLEWTFGEKALKDRPYGHGLILYPMGGPKVEEVPVDAAAYGPRSAKLILHYKHQWSPDGSGEQAVMLQHHEDMARAFDAHLPCKGFFNYIDNTKPCAKTNEEWLAAHFHNVSRMRQIKVEADPKGVFRSRLSKPNLELRPPRSTTLRLVSTTTSPRDWRQCASHPACSGLIGNCCPSNNGSTLNCCNLI